MAGRRLKKIGVPIHLVDLSKQFSELVINPFLEQYASGLTPSPCPICNSRIKMGLLFEHARQLGCEALATGIMPG